MQGLGLLPIENFINYLNFRECYEEDRRRTHILFLNKNHPHLSTSVPRSADNMLHVNEIYFICKALQIDMPPIPGYAEKAKELDKIFFNENYPNL